ncbi:MAG: hypothetical protein IPP83_12830 [Flavobacteriales bacterium]|nr:hypothetical protein [Flavobacteriales bacterium]
MARIFRLLPLVLAAIASAVTGVVSATQWTVDNSPNSPGQYTSLQDAIDNAASWDTLLITGTNITYGTVVISQPITLIGAGYNPNALETIVDQLTLLSSDVFISGLHGGILFDLENADGDTLANITITRCRLENPGINFYASSQAGAGRLIDIDIYNNVIGQFGFNGCFTQNQMRFDSLLFANNIASRFTLSGGCVPQFQGTETFIIDHNLFIGYSGACTIGVDQLCGIFSDQFGNSAWTNSSAILSNNIFHLQSNGGIRGCGNCTWFNNITTTTGGGNDSIPGTPLGNENQWSIDPASVLVNYAGGVFDWGHDYSLQVASTAINAASDGSDIGISGGQHPYVIGAPPHGPVIEYFNVDGSAIEINGDVIINFRAYGR